MHSENVSEGNKCRNEYLYSLKNFIKKRQKESEKKRAGFNAEELKKMLGYPLCELEPARVSPKLTPAYEGVLRVQVEILGVSFYGLLFEPENKACSKTVISIHGGQGTPEMTAGIYETHNYNSMTKRFRDKGVRVFAPQLLLWNQQCHGDEFDRNAIDNELKQLGGSIAALELYYIISMINYFEGDIFLSGLSYGGFYALYAAAIEPRVKGCLSSCFFSDRIIYNWSDFVWFNSGNRFSDFEVASLILPRKLYIELGEKDEVFKTEYALPHLKKLKGENFKYNIFNGGHEFCPTDDGIDWLLEE